MLRIPDWIRVPFGQLSDDCRAVAAIEFAMIAPLMLVLAFGTIEISSGVAIDRKVTLIARTLADLTSQSTSVSDVDLDGFTITGKAILTPYSSTPLKATITELWIDPSTSNARVQWSRGSVVRTPGSLVSVPSDLIVKDATGKTLPDQYLIYSEIEYKYDPAVGYIMKAGVTLSDVAYTRPRQLRCVVYPSPASGAAMPACPKV